MPVLLSSSETRYTWRASALLCVIVLVGGAIRWHGIAETGLSIDEIVSMMFSTGRPAAQFDQPSDVLCSPGHDMLSISDARSLRSVWLAPRDDTHPPLHAVLLRCWRIVFGEGDVSARSLSVFFSVLAIPLLFDVARLLHGRTVALWAAAIFAVASPQLDFAQQVRGYTMLLALSITMLDAIVRIEALGASARRLTLLSLATFLAAMTHYNAIPIALAVGIYSLIQLRGGDRSRAIIALAIAGALFTLIQGPTLWGQRHNFGPNLAWLAEDRQGLLGRTLVRLAGLPLRFFIIPMTRDRESGIASIAAIFYLLPLTTLFVGRFLGTRRDLLLWCLVGGVTIAVVALSDFIAARRTLEHIRFTLAATPAAYVIAAAIGSKLKGPFARHVIPGVFVVGCLLALPTAYARDEERDLRGFAEAFDRAAGPNDVIVTTFNGKGEDWFHPALIASITHYAHAPRRPLLILSRPIDQAMRDRLGASPAVLFVHRDPLTPPFESFLPGTSMKTRIAIPYVGSATRVEWIVGPR